MRTPLEPHLEAYVTEGLKRNQFTRSEKKNHLAGIKVIGEDAEKILDKLYGELNAQPR